MQIDKYSTMQEEELKSAVMVDFFKDYKYTQLGKIDFVIMEPESKTGQLSLNISKLEKSFLWAEAKRGARKDIYESFVQLILTIGKAKTYEKYLPPKFLGAIDAEKCAFIEYSTIQNIFYMNDFNWNVTSSDHDTKEFKLLYDKCKGDLEKSSYIFNYNKNLKEFKKFIKQNFNISDGVNKIAVTKNNFTFVFKKWCEEVKPSIDIDWEAAKKVNIIESDFFLADLISEKDESLKENLYVVLKKTKYILAKKIDLIGTKTNTYAFFKDNQKAYRAFWSIYERPPKQEYWNEIIDRRDLLVPQDIRERKGSFFTPQIWVERSQQYIEDFLGENWQDEYIVWDCCAGTGNLLNGLINKSNLWASTLDQADVDVMKDRVQNGWNMYNDHIFQFDFLNDDFSKLPEKLKNIINDKEKRKKLLIYINPPYAEAGSKCKENKRQVATKNKTYLKYKNILGKASNELYAQFLIRIYKELHNCIIANFATLKIVCNPNFIDFRNNFKANLERLFIMPSNTFDNVRGIFPIGFYIWNTQKNVKFSKISADVYDAKNNKSSEQKIIKTIDNKEVISKWLSKYYDKDNNELGFIHIFGGDFQSQQQIRLTVNDTHNHTIRITQKNIIEICINFSVRLCIKHTLLNHNDNYLYPNEKYKNDIEFQNNCLIYTLFHNKNNIDSNNGVNHWIPFKEKEIGCNIEFDSHFMSDFLDGKIKQENTTGQIDLFNTLKQKYNKTVLLSKEAQEVYNSGKELWKYYHSKENININASLYEIRDFFQGRDEKGRMKTKSEDKEYMRLLGKLKEKMEILRCKIEPKVYEYNFLNK